mgnify:CR=1 FL=1
MSEGFEFNGIERNLVNKYTKFPTAMQGLGYKEVVEYFDEVGIEFVQHIGRVLVFYKHSDNIDNPIVLPIKK